MGQFRPSQQRRRRAVPSRDLALFAAGFTLSASTTFVVLHALSARTVAHLPVAARSALAVAVAALLVAADWRRVARGMSCSLGPRRQTPRLWGRTPLGVLAWGLDTGVPVTTVRSSVLPYLGLVLTGLAFGAPWIGLAYAAGFLVPLWALCAVPARQGHTAAQDSAWVARAMARLVLPARILGLVLASAGTLAAGILA